MSDHNNRNTVRLPHNPPSQAAALRPLQAIAMVLMWGAASLASAQQLVDISSCASIADDKQRFACYDDLARKAGALPAAKPAAAATPATPAATLSAPAAASAPASAAAPAAPVKPATAPVATSTDSTRIAAFGNASQARIEAASNGQEMLIDTVTAVKDYKQDLVQLTLSSGQTWRQMVAQRFLLRAGDKVHIVPNPWGNSFRLTAEGRDAYIQVEKVGSK